MPPTSFTLPDDFLSEPAPNIQIQKIDFTKTALPEYKDLYAVILDDAFTEAECGDLIRAAEARTDGN